MTSGAADTSRRFFLPGAAANSAPRKTRNIPVRPSSSVTSSRPSATGDPMDVTSPASITAGSALPAAHSSPESDRTALGQNPANGSSAADGGQANNNGVNLALGAAAAAQQPKVVQTAFIHKLYNMLEDPSIQHLISWSNTNDSFVMSPTSEFSKVLAQYFKHTNISSFVRQLNMYGFHKVSDVFHTGSPDSALWEFKHGNGNFKRGDLVGLREIKRRASRHALIHRDSFAGHKAAVASQPGTPVEPAPDATDARLMNLEHSLYDVHNRLARAEEGNAVLGSRCQGLIESLSKCHQFNHSLCQYLLALVPDRDSPLHRDVSNMQREVERQLDQVRVLELPHDGYHPGRPPFFANISVDPGPPLSPRQVPQDDSRRPSVTVLDPSPRPHTIRPPLPPHLAASPRRYGSIGAANNSPNYNRPPPPPVHPHQPQPPSQPHPLSTVSSPPGPNLARRHTSADIRQHGWPPPGVSPFPGSASNASLSAAAAAAAGPWPPSPRGVGAPTSSDQQVRDVLAQYEMGTPRRYPTHSSRHASPPPPPPPPLAAAAADMGPSAPAPASHGENGWSKLHHHHHRQERSLPATRRSSMASNVYSLLNSAEMVERPEEESSPLGGEERKRKRRE